MDVNKTDLRNFKNLLIHEVDIKNVDVKLNAEVTPDYIKETKPDAIILALGSSRLSPSIPGIDSALHAIDAYDSAQECVCCA